MKINYSGQLFNNYKMIQHIIPLNDLYEHSEIIKNHLGLLIPLCNCEPKVNTEYGTENAIVIHNSFDGREGVEWANEILNSKK